MKYLPCSITMILIWTVWAVLSETDARRGYIAMIIAVVTFQLAIIAIDYIAKRMNK